MRTVAVLAALFILGLAVNLIYGRRGFMPMDQGIVFDGAWRLFSGQVPFRDFDAPNAIVPSAMQLPFFQFFGVTWLAFVLHAAVINGAFCALAYWILRLCDATRIEAAFYAAVSAFYFYPPNGTPFMDQHAFFFVALMLAMAAAGTRASTPDVEWAAWFFVPILFVLAYGSKQIPTAFGALAVAAWVVLNPRRARWWIGPLLAGTVAALLALAAIGWWLRVNPIEAWTYLVQMPLGVGTERTTQSGILAPVRLILGTMRRLPGWAHQWTMYVPFAGVIVAVAGFRVNERWRLQAWLIASMMFITAAFVAYTINQIENGLCLIMLTAGLAAVVLRRTISALPAGAFGRRTAVALAVVIAAVTVRDAVVFATTVDATRSVLDTVYRPELADRAAKVLPDALRFVRWTPINCDPEELADMVRYLSASPRNFLLISDITPLYALAGKPSVSPALWLHPGLSIPQLKTPQFDRLEDEMLRRVRAFDVQYLVLDEPHTLRDISIVNFPRLRALQQGCPERTFGSVRVVEICAH